LIADLGHSDDYADGAIRIVEVDGRELGVVRWGNDFFAVRNVCPHQAGPVCMGLVGPHISSGARPGELTLDVDRPVLACPWHGWEFDIRTGRSAADGGYRVRTYPVTLARGRLKVDLAARPA
jgi:nitrite reductase/ring-hydroxylating ferredoxin subunit